MIIVKLMGGLGNQMFQYATARRLALQHNSELVLDGSYFAQCPSGDTPRQYELHHLSLNARFAKPIETAELSGLYKNQWQKTVVRFRRFAGLACPAPYLYQELNGGYLPEVLTLPDNVYLSGYWQSERYFFDIAETIRKEFEVKSALQNENLELARQIEAIESVAVHYRRGDYISNPKTADYHGVLSPGYYQRAVELLCEQVHNPHLFIFSDDPEWVKESVTFPLPTQVVDHNPPERACEDLRLMSHCKHAIIANSSFSWWGAWLNRNPEKVVIAPQRWANVPRSDLADLLPAAWQRVDA